MNLNKNSITVHTHIVVLRLPFVAEVEFGNVGFWGEISLGAKEKQRWTEPANGISSRRLSRLDCGVCICRSISYRSNTNIVQLRFPVIVTKCWSFNILCSWFLRVSRGARNANLQFGITHASHVCSQHSFGLPLIVNGVHKTQFDHARFYFLSLVICSRVFWPSVTWNLRKAQRWSKVWTSDRCRPHSLTFGYY